MTLCIIQKSRGCEINVICFYKYIFIIEQIKSLKFNCITFFPTGYTEYTYFRYMPKCICTMLRLIFNGTSDQPENLSIPRSPLLKTVKSGSAELL